MLKFSGDPVEESKESNPKEVEELEDFEYNIFNEVHVSKGFKLKVI